jgi:DNA-binding transcriptional LysR family regulator
MSKKHSGTSNLSDSAKLDLRSLRYVLVLAEAGSFAAAATVLGITQPALSRSVRVLEGALGVRLFDRGRSGALPTSFGRLLVERGRALLADAAAVERELQLLDGADTGVLAIGAGAYPAQICVGQAAARLIARHPALELRIVVADWPELIHQVLAGELDVAVCEVETAETDERLHTEALPVHRGYLFCRTGHPLEHRASVDLATAQKYPLALTALPPRSALLGRDRGRGADGTTLATALHVDTFELARKIVLGSDALGAATRSMLADDVRAGRVAILPIHEPWLSTRYGFIHRAGRSLSPSARAFMAIVREVEKEFSDSEGTRAASRQAKETVKRPRDRVAQGMP